MTLPLPESGGQRRERGAGGGHQRQTLQVCALVTAPRAIFDRAPLLTQGVGAMVYDAEIL